MRRTAFCAGALWATSIVMLDRGEYVLMAGLLAASAACIWMAVKLEEAP